MNDYDRYELLTWVFGFLAAAALLIAFALWADSVRNAELLDCLNRGNDAEWCVEHF